MRHHPVFIQIDWICMEDLVDSSSPKYKSRFYDGDSISILRPETASNGDIITKLPCNHDLHGMCLLLWLLRHITCPICRFNLPKDFGVKSALHRLGRVLLMAPNEKITPPLVYRVFLFTFCYMDLNPSIYDDDGGGSELNPLFIRAMKQLREATTTTTRGGGRAFGRRYERCASCSGELHYESEVPVACLLCRCNLGKDVEIKEGVERLIRVLELQNKSKSWYLIWEVYLMFECLVYLLVRDRDEYCRCRARGAVFAYTRRPLCQCLKWMDKIAAIENE